MHRKILHVDEGVFKDMAKTGVIFKPRFFYLTRTLHRDEGAIKFPMLIMQHLRLFLEYRFHYCSAFFLMSFNLTSKSPVFGHF